MAGVATVGPPPDPPVVTLPAPAKCSVIEVIGPLAVPVMVGKEPVAPAKLPVPPVIVAEPEPVGVVPRNRVTGIVIVPVRVPPEAPAIVIVKGALALVPVRLEVLSVAV